MPSSATLPSPMPHNRRDPGISTRPEVEDQHPYVATVPPQGVRSYRYEVETDQGKYEIELDREVPEGPAGQRMLEELLAEQLQNNRQNYPITAAIHDVGRGVVGGVRDAAQDVINTPVDIFNTITGFVSSEPPGKPAELGPRQRLIPEIQPPELPDVGTPENRTEQISRLLSRIAADMVPVGSIAMKATKGLRAASKALRLNPLQRRTLHAMSGANDVRHLNRGGLVISFAIFHPYVVSDR